MIALKIRDTVIELDEEVDGVRELDGRWAAKIDISGHRYYAVVDLIHLGAVPTPIGDDE